jgi:AcrR family transcriptional regulator
MLTMKEAVEAKEKIMLAAAQLMEESGGNPDTVTTRAIAEKAGVGIGLINYHFQTKENLIELCVQQIIGNVIYQFKPDGIEHLKGSELLSVVVKMVADFLTENPSVSRISILGDFKLPKSMDNTMKTVKGFCSSLIECDLSEQEKNLLAFTITSVLQAMFLRKEISKELFGFDFNNKSERDSFIDFLIKRTIR